MLDVVKKCNSVQCNTYDMTLKINGWAKGFTNCSWFPKMINFRRGYLEEGLGIENDSQKSDFNNNICPYCKGKLIDTQMESDEFNIIETVSDYNRQLLEAMIELKQKDIIEYELKMSQFRTQYEQMQALKKQQQIQEKEQSDMNKPRCPYCKSTNIKKISGASKAGKVAVFGVFALGKVNKQWHCNSCGSDF